MSTSTTAFCPQLLRKNFYYCALDWSAGVTIKVSARKRQKKIVDFCVCVTYNFLIIEESVITPASANEMFYSLLQSAHMYVPVLVSLPVDFWSWEKSGEMVMNFRMIFFWRSYHKSCWSVSECVYPFLCEPSVDEAFLSLCLFLLCAGEAHAHTRTKTTFTILYKHDCSRCVFSLFFFHFSLTEKAFLQH